MADFDYTFYWRAAFESLPEMLGGAWVTVQIAMLSMGLGTVLAVFLTLGAQSSRWMLRTPAALWVSVARNTPALFQVYMLYFGLGAFGLHLGSWLALVAGITFNNAGYLAETFRGGLKAIPSTQLRAARSLGMSAPQALRLVILPQLLRVVFYPLTNQFVWAVLMTSLGVVVGMTSDLAGVTQALNVRTFRTFEFFAIAAVLYYLLAKFVGVMTRVIAWRLFRY